VILASGNFSGRQDNGEIAVLGNGHIEPLFD